MVVDPGSNPDELFFIYFQMVYSSILLEKSRKHIGMRALKPKLFLLITMNPPKENHLEIPEMGSNIYCDRDSQGEHHKAVQKPFAY